LKPTTVDCDFSINNQQSKINNAFREKDDRIMSSPVSSLRILPAPMESAARQFPAASGGGFADTLRGAMDEMGQLQSQAETKVASVLEGGGGDVHSALIAVEKADLSFQLMMQVRNKIVSAYQEIARMQF
jgi:flagellar hook-basal body complex protein FliE